MSIWEKTFSSREWGKYPPELLVKIATRFSRSLPNNLLSVCLDLGSGPGANTYLLNSLFDRYCAIDISPTAIRKVSHMLKGELNAYDLVVGNIANLPWEDSTFDFICDNLSIYANHSDDIKVILEEVNRVLKPNGLFYSRVWGKSTHGLASGSIITDITFDDLVAGPCKGYGLSSFFTLDEIRSYYCKFGMLEVIRLSHESIDLQRNPPSPDDESIVEEYIIIASKE